MMWISVKREKNTQDSKRVTYEGVFKRFRAKSTTKYTLTFGIAR